MYAVYSFLAGLIFGIGLIVSQMISPGKILAFLDVTGRWDPSLLLVMAAAVAVSSIAYLVSRTRTTSLLGTPMIRPRARDIDRRLIGGSIVFGIGWGLSGFCPGPAIAALGTGHIKAFLFVFAMIMGMGIFELVERRFGSGGSAAGRQHLRASEHVQPASRQRTRKGG